MGWERRPSASSPSKMCANETVGGEIDISVRAVLDRVAATRGALWDAQSESSSIFHIIQVLIKLCITDFQLLSPEISRHTVRPALHSGRQ